MGSCRALPFVPANQGFESIVKMLSALLNNALPGVNQVYGLATSSYSDDASCPFYTSTINRDRYLQHLDDQIWTSVRHPFRAEPVAQPGVSNEAVTGPSPLSARSNDRKLDATCSKAPEMAAASSWPHTREGF